VCRRTGIRPAAVGELYGELRHGHVAMLADTVIAQPKH